MRFITANKIFSGREFLAEDTVIVLNQNEKIIDLIDSKKTDNLNIESFEGIISPGFINAHCHLELSHLKNAIQQKTGIVNFALDIIKKRNVKQIDIQLEEIERADCLMDEQGIVAVGDICNTDTSIITKQKSKIYYHSFIELIGLNPEQAFNIFDRGLMLMDKFRSNHLNASLAAHAPYSSSKELIKLISNHCRDINKPTTIHNQESKAENDFFISKTGDFTKLYDVLNLDTDYFTSTQTSSLRSVLNSFNKEVNTLLVHNTFTNQEDIDFALSSHTRLFWCLCAKANLYIENTLPNIGLLISKNCQLTLGTDSLASNSNLSIIEEINTIKKQFPEIEIEILLKMATYNGAHFLGIEDKFGLIEKGRYSGLNLIKGNANNYGLEKLV
ncbi:MAG: amidohydrolase family protein [Bacteroidota bacterium]|jgi:cytosine/adenosine deaminase-related metal-dependent hydrolase